MGEALLFPQNNTESIIEGFPIPVRTTLPFSLQFNDDSRFAHCPAESSFLVPDDINVKTVCLEVCVLHVHTQSCPTLQPYEM